MTRSYMSYGTRIYNGLEIWDISTFWWSIFLTIFECRESTTIRRWVIPSFDDSTWICNYLITGCIDKFCYIRWSHLVWITEIFLEFIRIIGSIIEIRGEFTISGIHIIPGIWSGRYSYYFYFFSQIRVRYFTESFEIPFHSKIIDYYQFTILVDNSNSITKEIIIVFIQLIPIWNSIPRINPYNTMWEPEFSSSL